MLLIIEALLLISAVLGQDNRTADVERSMKAPEKLDMADDSVDDKFYHCIKKMEHRVQTEFLKKEMTNSDFGKFWEVAENDPKRPAPGDNLSKNHSVAIYVYTSNGIYKTFNAAVHDGKQKYKDGTYSWYSLHFWLTEAIQILKKTQSECYDTYRGTDVEYDKTVKGKEIRFGQFASSSLDRKVATRPEFGAKSCFEIRTCSGVELTKYSRYPDEKEVLIPPYETFKVIDVKSRAEQKDPWCDTVYTLKGYKKRSFLNCAAANSGNQVAFFNVLLILIIFCNVVSY